MMINNFWTNYTTAMTKPEKRPKVAFITGGAKRLGEAMTRDLHRQGYNVAIGCSQSTAHATEMARGFNQQVADSAKVFAYDLCRLEGLSELINQVISWHGELTLLINNAACFYRDSDEVSWERQFQLNTMAPYYLSEQAYPVLAKSQGSIINIADVYGLAPKDDYAIYSMTKAALISQTKSLAKRFAPKVRVNAICPGAMLWPENGEFSEQEKSTVMNTTLLQRLGGAEPIVKAMNYLISNDFVTNSTLQVDGGG